MSSLAYIQAGGDDFPTLLRDVPENYSTDVVLEQEAARLEALDFLPFEPDEYDLEQNLDDVATLLDRLLGYRREINAIEAERVRVGLGYASAINMAEADAEIELARNPEAGAAFEGAVRAKVERLREAVRALDSRHDMAGSPLNYTHRRTKLEAQMRSEVESLFCRARVINKGLEVFGYFDAARRLLMPSTAERIYATFAGAGYVDDLCLWHRQVARDVEQIQAREATYEVTLSLGMDFNHVGHLRTGYRDYFYSDPTRRGALVQNLLDQLRERARLSFSLRDQDQNFPYPGLTPELSSALGAFARIEAVAVTVTLPAEAKKDWRFHVKLVRDDHFDSEILLSNVGPLEDGPRWLSNRTLANRPLKGLWSMDFLPDPIVNGGAGDARRLDRTQWPIQDVQLHVRLTARQRE